MNKKQKENRGFTIIEALVVMVITAVVLTGSIIKQREAVQRKRAERAALQIKQLLEQTKDFALTGEMINATTVPEAFRFRITGGGSNYNIQSVIGGSATNYRSGSIDYSGDVSIQNALISFTVPNGEREAGCTPASCEINICGDGAGCADASLKYTVSVTENSIGFK